ncbi:MAG: RIP metalloprotease RseP [Nitrospiraceae bacterium]|nr:RIP metalloprotease RseP [Nitrospiraceae bacterium]
MILFWAAVLLGILIFVHEFGHFIFAKFLGVKVLKFSLGFGPKVAGFKTKNTEYLISALPLGGYVKMLGEEQGEELDPAEKRFAFNFQPVWKKMVIVFAGPFFNVLLTFLIFCVFLAVKLPVNIPKFNDITPKVGAVMKGSPAEKAGIMPGDTITSINGKPVSTWMDLVAIISAQPGHQVSITVKRGNGTLDFKLVPEAAREKNFEGKTVITGRIGIQRAGDVIPFYVIQAGSIIAVPYKASVATYRLSVFICQSVKSLITGAFSLSSIGGPITIVQESGKAASLGIMPYLMFMAFISINLAILNLLPVPVLDGGHIFFFAMEAARGKPLSETTQMNLQRVGIILLVTLMVFAVRNDIMRLLGGG